MDYNTINQVVESIVLRLVDIEEGLIENSNKRPVNVFLVKRMVEIDEAFNEALSMVPLDKEIENLDELYNKLKRIDSDIEEITELIKQDLKSQQE